MTPPKAPFERSGDECLPDCAPFARRSTIGPPRSVIASAFGPEFPRQALQIEPLSFGHVGAAERREQHAVGGVEGARVGLLVERATRRGAARLERDPERAAGCRAAAPKRLVDRGGMMREVVVDAHATAARRAGPAAGERLRTPRDGARRREVHGEPLGARRERRERVPHVVLRPERGARTSRTRRPRRRSRTSVRRPESRAAGAASQVGVTSPVSSPSSA